jgi:uncharacterized protein (TIGR00299 family) protein
MTLGALVDLGVPIEELKRELASLPVGGYEISSRRVMRCGIGATLVRVQLLDEHEHHHDHGHQHEHEHSHEHGHGHGHSHDHGHDHPHDHGHTHEHEHGHHHDHGHTHSHEPQHAEAHSHSHSHDHSHRGFSEIRRIIEGSKLAPSVKERAIAAFHKIAVAEAAVHETTIEAVHFHEVGAVDAIVDIVGSMWALDQLGVTHVTASPVAVGSGTIKVAHGVMPIPAPATARILAGKPITSGPVTGELTTPTGAAILTTIAAGFGGLDNFQISNIGYGAGTREYPQHTNYLRVLLGEVAKTGSVIDLPVNREQLAVITTEIDDMPAEVFGHVMERLFDMGCLDVQLLSTQMKKNRPGSSLHVLVHPDNVARAIELLLRETTTFGVKVLPCERYSLKRRMETVQTPYGEVRVKIGLWGDEVLKRTPEYEDCRRLAVQHNAAFMQVFAAAATSAQKQKE